MKEAQLHILTWETESSSASNIVAQEKVFHDFLDILKE